MSRFARIVVPGVPHHVIQRGNRRQEVFFSDFDKALYLDILTRNIKNTGLEIWAYCLMNNHVHLVAVPSSPSSLADGIGSTHKEYTRKINMREGWKGYLWQGRFFSCPMDVSYLYTAVKYVECNPVRAAIAKRAEEYHWSSARAHIHRIKDSILTDFPLYQKFPDWSHYLRTEESPSVLDELRKHLRTGRPLGDKAFLTKIEKITGRTLIKVKPGPKKDE